MVIVDAALWAVEHIDVWFLDPLHLPGMVPFLNKLLRMAYLVHNGLGLSFLHEMGLSLKLYFMQASSHKTAVRLLHVVHHHGHRDRQQQLADVTANFAQTLDEVTYTIRTGVPELLVLSADTRVLPPWQQVCGHVTWLVRFACSCLTQTLADPDPDYLRDINRIVREHSQGSRVVVLPVPKLPHRDLRTTKTSMQVAAENFMHQLREMTAELPCTLLVGRE